MQLKKQEKDYVIMRKQSIKNKSKNVMSISSVDIEEIVTKTNVLHRYKTYIRPGFHIRTL